MSNLEDSIFEEDISFLNLINIIESGDNDYILATEVDGGCMPAKFTFQSDHLFCLSFKMPNNMFEHIESDFFFTHHMLLKTQGLNILIQNKNVGSFEQNILQEEGGFDTKIFIDSFRADIDDKLWMNSKQAVYCFF